MPFFKMDERRKSVSNSISVHATQKPKWYQLRWKLSNLLMRMANRVYPENPEVFAFMMKIMMDQMITGGSIVRIDPRNTFMGENIPKEQFPS